MLISKKERLKIENNLASINRYIKTIQGPGLNKISEITNNIYVSNVDNMQEMSLLKEYGISSILYIGKLSLNKKILQNYTKRKIQYKYMGLSNISTNKFDIRSYLDESYEYIHKFVNDNKKILLVCDNGISMSIILLLYYLLKRYYTTNMNINKQKTLDLIYTDVYFLTDILKFIKESRPCAEPDIDHIYQLLLVEYVFKNICYNKILVDAQNYIQKKSKKSKNNNDSDSDSDNDSEPDINMDDENDKELYEERIIDEYLTDKFLPDNLSIPKTKSKKKVSFNFDKLSDLKDIADNNSNNNNLDNILHSSSDSDSDLNSE